MVKFYFFKIVCERNEQGEWRKRLYPLPGQFTYVNSRMPSVPVDTTLRVQLRSSENGKIVRLWSDDIVGVRHEGDDQRATKLSKYTRNDGFFYRSESEVFYVPRVSFLEVPRDGIRFAAEDMKQAYLDLVSRTNDAHVATPSAPATPSSTARPEGAPAPTPQSPRASEPNDNIITEEPTRIQMRELDAIESHLLLEMSERQTAETLLLISQIKDRMRIGVTKFAYEKQTGELRVAYGTRNTEIIEMVSAGASRSERSLNRNQEYDGEHFRYFDLEKKEWRMFCTPDIKSVTIDFLMTSTSAIRDFINSHAA